MNHTPKRRQIRGFTLVELMMVTAVLVILAAVSIVGYGTWRQSVAQKEVQTDLRTVAAAMLSHRNFNDGYPTSLPSDFKSSPNVQTNYISGSSTGYCVEAVSKVNPDVKYYFSSNGKVPVVGSCDGIVLADESGSGTATGPSCNTGDVLSGTTCTHTYGASYQSGGYSCPSGGSLSGTTCTVSTSANYSSGGGYYYCPSGGSISGTTCTSTSSYSATWVSGGLDYCLSGYTHVAPGVCQAPNGSQYSSESQGYTCPSGGYLSGSTCNATSSYSATYYSYSGYYYCSGGATLSGSSCTSTYAASQGGGAYTCPSGGTLSGTTCTQTYTAS